jgi:hypothetical protein
MIVIIIITDFFWLVWYNNNNNNYYFFKISILKTKNKTYKNGNHNIKNY